MLWMETIWLENLIYGTYKISTEADLAIWHWKLMLKISTEFHRFLY